MVAEILDRYFAVFPDEMDRLQLLRDQVKDNEALNTRKNFRGHITGGAIVLSPDHQKVLVVHHRLFQRWLQPGGHWDPEEASPLAAARREAVEETNAHIARYVPLQPQYPLVPFDIDTHYIMPRPDKDGGEPEHYHHDFRYLFIAKNETLQPLMSEVSESVWMDLKDPRLTDISSILGKLHHFTL